VSCSKASLESENLKKILGVVQYFVWLMRHLLTLMCATQNVKLALEIETRSVDILTTDLTELCDPIDG